MTYMDPNLIRLQKGMEPGHYITLLNGEAVILMNNLQMDDCDPESPTHLALDLWS